ncbi:MAG: AAA family ATPase [Bacteroidetes bacterium]|nr:AAA family ATPase [Bacteroidota bacterium]
MKVTRIHIKDYLNFKNEFEIDLRYPSDHPDRSKAGKPLEKICFIGPSGTGKTTLLNIIKFFSFENKINPDCLNQDQLKDGNVGVHFLIGNSYKCSKWSIGFKGNEKEKIEAQPDVELNYIGENGLDSKDCKKYIEQHFFKSSNVKLVSFPYDAIRNFYSLTDLSNSNYLSGITKPEDEKKDVNLIRQEYLEKKVWDFSNDNINWIWKIFEDIVEEYKPNYLRELNKFLSKSKEDDKNHQKYFDDFKEWEIQNKNPLDEHSQKLDVVLNKFNLKVDTTIVQEKVEKKFPIIRQVNNKDEVPKSFLSTGTVQLLVTTLPLSVLNIDKAIILIDEPERSLYPDTQLGLISLYTSYAKDSQVFFATHSPIIASAFDPSERIILYFNDEGKIDFKRGDSPEGDDPNDLLYRDFGMHNIFEKKGEDAYKRYIELKTLIHSEKNKEKQEELMVEYLEIARIYRFGKSNEKNT